MICPAISWLASRRNATPGIALVALDRLDLFAIDALIGEQRWESAHFGYDAGDNHFAIAKRTFAASALVFRRY